LAAGAVASAAGSGRVTTRVAAAAVLVPAVIALTWIGGWAFDALLLACAALLGREWARVCQLTVDRPLTWALVSGPAAVIGLAALVSHPSVGLAAGAILAVAVSLAGSATVSGAVGRWLGAGAIAIVLAGISLMWLRNLEPSGLWLTVWLFLVIWSNDTVAFFTGRAIGGPRLAPGISPGKTWAGLLGGLAAGVLIGFAAAWLISGEASWSGAAAGFLLAFAGNVGDLFESRLKRRFHSKDSGGLIPGHGGFLDRLDSLLVAAPVAAGLYLLEWRWL